MLLQLIYKHIGSTWGLHVIWQYGVKCATNLKTLKVEIEVVICRERTHLKK